MPMPPYTLNVWLDHQSVIASQLNPRSINAGQLVIGQTLPVRLAVYTGTPPALVDLSAFDVTFSVESAAPLPLTGQVIFTLDDDSGEGVDIDAPDATIEGVLRPLMGAGTIVNRIEDSNVFHIRSGGLGDLGSLTVAFATDESVACEVDVLTVGSDATRAAWRVIVSRLAPAVIGVNDWTNAAGILTGTLDMTGGAWADLSGDNGRIEIRLTDPDNTRLISLPVALRLPLNLIDMGDVIAAEAGPSIRAYVDAQIAAGAEVIGVPDFDSLPRPGATDKIYIVAAPLALYVWTAGDYEHAGGGETPGLPDVIAENAAGDGMTALAEGSSELVFANAGDVFFDSGGRAGTAKLLNNSGASINNAGDVLALTFNGGTLSGNNTGDASTTVFNGVTFSGSANVIQLSKGTSQLILTGGLGIPGLSVNGVSLGTAAGSATGDFATAAQGTLATNAVPNTRTVNGQALSSNVTITTISGNAGSATLAAGLSVALATAKGGLAADNSAASGIPVFAAGVATVTAATGTGAPVRETAPTIDSLTFTGNLTGPATTIVKAGSLTAIQSNPSATSIYGGGVNTFTAFSDGVDVGPYYLAFGNSFGAASTTLKYGASSGVLYIGTYGAYTTGTLVSGAMVLGATTVAVSAIVDLTSTAKGFLPPRMTTTQRMAISSPAEGLMVYDLTLHKLCVYTGSAWETVTSL